MRLTAPLTAITAAMVGVIASLTVFFAWHVFHLAEPLARWDWVAISALQRLPPSPYYGLKSARYG
jgi:chromate transporter